MKLASMRNSVCRDGILVVVNRALTHYQVVHDIAPTLQSAIDNWPVVAPKLQAVYEALNKQSDIGETLEVAALMAPLPRAYQWLDGSAYLSHVERVRKARNAEMPSSFLHDPLMYQGASDSFIGPTEPVYAKTADWGIDFEAEVCVITDDVKVGVSESQAVSRIILLMLTNDVSFRQLIPDELAKGFGFIHGKPSSAFSPVAVTPDELGGAWEETKVHLPLLSYLNGTLFGRPNAGEGMQFSFAQLIVHASKTRDLIAGTVIGSGTVSNQDETVGCSCLVEKRVLEIIKEGSAKTEFLQFGDRVKIEMLDENGQSIFGAIDQQIKQL